MIQKTKKLNDSVEIPLIGLGTWQVNGAECTQMVSEAFELGYRHFDTAQVYENHKAVGEALKGIPKDQYFLSTKLAWDFLEPDLVEKQCDICLKELGIDQIDLFLIHWPNRQKPMLKVMEKMYELKEKKKIRSVGVSNFTVKHLEDLANAGMKVSVNQVEFHPYLYQENLLNYCNMNQITIEAHSPLAGGKVFSDPFLSKMGEKYGKTATQITLAYLLHLGFIAIPKASSKEHLEQNLSAQEIILEKEDIDSIIKMNENLRLICPSVQDFDYK